MKEKRHNYGKPIVHRYGSYVQCKDCGEQCFAEKEMYKTPCKPILKEGVKWEDLEKI